MCIESLLESKTTNVMQILDDPLSRCPLLSVTLGLYSMPRRLRHTLPGMRPASGLSSITSPGCGPHRRPSRHCCAW